MYLYDRQRQQSLIRGISEYDQDRVERYKEELREAESVLITAFGHNPKLLSMWILALLEGRPLRMVAKDMHMSKSTCCRALNDSRQVLAECLMGAYPGARGNHLMLV
jgi:DNA-directed RNA polymerase specialized sigma24 family protein